MKMMKSGVRAGLLLLAVALMLPVSAQGQTAEERRRAEERARVEMERERAREAMEEAREEMREARIRIRELHEDCRCVDDQGNEVENCTCLNIPAMELAELGTTIAEGFFAPARRARIGVYVDAGDIETAQGALLTEVMEDGPAWEAGLRAGDIITHVDGRSVLEPLADRDAESDVDPDESVAVQRFVAMAGDLEPEEAVEIRYLRDGDSRTAEVTPESAGAQVFAGALRGGENPFMVWEDDGEMAVELRALMEDGRILGLEREELRRGAEEMRRELERMRESGEFPFAEGFEFRFPGRDEAGEDVRFEFRGPGESRNGFVFLGGDPCLTPSGEEGGLMRGFLRAGDCLDGVEFVELNPELAEYFDAPAAGVLVTEVAEAATLGLRSGDVLLAIGGREVRDPSHARRILSSYELDEEVRLLVIRQGREMEVLGRRRQP